MKFRYHHQSVLLIGKVFLVILCRVQTGVTFVIISSEKTFLNFIICIKLLKSNTKRIYIGKKVNKTLNFMFLQDD